MQCVTLVVRAFTNVSYSSTNTLHAQHASHSHTHTHMRARTYTCTYTLFTYTPFLVCVAASAGGVLH